MAVVAKSAGGKPALSRWKVLWRSPNGNASLLAVRIHTGRTHQIRVHLAHEGYPLLGDRLYAPKNVQMMAPRQMLHAWRLEFAHPVDGTPLHFACQPPEDMLHAALNAAHHTMRVVITGNPGSGKSTLAKELARLGVPTVSADALVDEEYAPGGEATQWIARLCQGRNTPLVTHEGEVDRAALMAAMREDSALRREVEHMVHSMVHDAIDAFWHAHEAEGTAFAAAEVPLFLETGWRNSFTPKPFIVGVRCPWPKRLQRIMANRGWSEEKAAALEAWQWPEERKMAACDLVLDNTEKDENPEQMARHLVQVLQEQQKIRETALARSLRALWAEEG